jgi:hypothetical protein
MVWPEGADTKTITVKGMEGNDAYLTKEPLLTHVRGQVLNNHILVSE